jgi:hypothetical protein
MANPSNSCATRTGSQIATSRTEVPTSLEPSPSPQGHPPSTPSITPTSPSSSRTLAFASVQHPRRVSNVRPTSITTARPRRPRALASLSSPLSAATFARSAPGEGGLRTHTTIRSSDGSRYRRSAVKLPRHSDSADNTPRSTFDEEGEWVEDDGEVEGKEVPISEGRAMYEEGTLYEEPEEAEEPPQPRKRLKDFENLRMQETISGLTVVAPLGRPGEYERYRRAYV